MVCSASKLLLTQHHFHNPVNLEDEREAATQDHMAEYQKAKDEPVMLATYSRSANSHWIDDRDDSSRPQSKSNPGASSNTGESTGCEAEEDCRDGCRHG